MWTKDDWATFLFMVLPRQRNINKYQRTNYRLHLPLHAVAVGGVVPHELEVLLVDALVGDGAGAAPALPRHRVLVVVVADVSEGSAGHLLGGARVTSHDT